MVRHSRKKKKIDNNHGKIEERRNIDSIPLDLLSEFFFRLPARYIAGLVNVSKKFATIIRSRDFLRSFSLRSSKQNELILLAFSELDKEKGCENWFFFSLALTTLKEQSSSSSPVVFLSRMACPLPDLRSDRPDCVHGLISFIYGREQIICNPSTGKSITLPSTEFTKTVVKRFFGYDPVEDQYKVLWMTERNKFQVLTLGPSSRDQNSWRKLKCSIRHLPRTDGICINGVLYYCAKISTKTKEPTLVRFNVRSEEFELLTKSPPEVQNLVIKNEIQNLINYEGNVALVTKSTFFYTFELWVLVDAMKQEWSKVSLSVNPWRHILQRRRHILQHARPLDIRGTAQTGEIIYASHDVDGFYLAHHDLKMKNVKKVEIDEDLEYDFEHFSGVVSYLNYAESLMFV